MFQLDDEFLKSVGLGSLPEDHKQAFLEHLYEELEVRVGGRLSAGMNNTQLNEFEKLIDGKDVQGATDWLSKHRPNYKEVVAEELEKIKQEVIANKDQILASA